MAVTVRCYVSSIREEYVRLPSCSYSPDKLDILRYQTAQSHTTARIVLEVFR